MKPIKWIFGRARRVPLRTSIMNPSPVVLSSEVHLTTEDVFDAGGCPITLQQLRITSYQMSRSPAISTYVHLSPPNLFLHPSAPFAASMNAFTFPWSFFPGEASTPLDTSTA